MELNNTKMKSNNDMFCFIHNNQWDCWLIPSIQALHLKGLSLEFMRFVRMRLGQWKVSVENDLKHEFAVNHERSLMLKENSMCDSIFASTSLWIA